MRAGSNEAVGGKAHPWISVRSLTIPVTVPVVYVYASPVQDETDRKRKCGRLSKYLDRNALDELWFATDGNVGWLLGGDPLIVRSSPVGAAAVKFDGETISVVTDTIEAERLKAEELPAGIAVEAVDWYEGGVEGMIETRASDAAGADIPVPGLATVEPRKFRLPATDRDIERLRRLGRDTAEALEATSREIGPTDTEREIAADLGYRLAARGIDAPLRLVGGEERAPAYRHFTPTDRTIGGYAVISVCARRCGLWVSATRTVAHDPPDWLADRHRAVCRVDATAISNTREWLDGGTAGDVFEAIIQAYDAVGHPEEWKRHHQGGATGYAPREWVATPGDHTRIRGPLGVAWNPTIQGAKSEDSVLVTEQEIEVVTATGEWPTNEVEPVTGGESIVRHDVLRLD